MSRPLDRLNDQMRPVRIIPGFLKHPDGSVLIETGDTRVLCSAMVEDRVPPFLKGSNSGWVTAEYSLLPASTETRSQREAARGKISGRTSEIQRLIGRSLRAVVDMGKLGERTIWIDCDVIQADGGTRTASITGSFVALYLALKKLKDSGIIKDIPLTDYVAAISVGIVEGIPLLDLEYVEDSSADVDMNVVMTGRGDFVEIQGTGEKSVFSRQDLDVLLGLAQKGIEELIALQKNILGEQI
ncbi:MAG: ribonuclease PH [Syntrophomonadaceae bacterium]|nr:ribonuclease PH [Syntrophomonadaceae bacterium]MDD3271384.1 ribonuclease PH [Syntrophomonadaceae bacterium]MDD3898610.1 ribonuclease PH [Syntrophomonadaceae bacterium]MDD4562515.1 ribonuclease PH [Syntrophomonadaceae bacterium]